MPLPSSEGARFIYTVGVFSTQKQGVCDENLCYAIKQDGRHDMDACEEYLYHALLIFFGRN